MKTVQSAGPGQAHFSQVPRVETPRSVFDRTHCYKSSFDAGFLYPFYVDEALPGDTFTMDATLFLREAPGFTAFMDNLFMDTFYFAVPLRLVWSNFEKFMGELEPGDTTQYLIPQVVAPTNGFGQRSLYDYMGVPPFTTGLSISALYTRAYNLVYNEWFRDQNIIASAVVDLDDGPDTATDYVLRRRGKRHDYFTSCLPWPQKGIGVDIPLSGSIPVVGIGVAANTGWSVGPTAVWETDAAGTVNYSHFKTTASVSFIMEGTGTTSTPKIYADLSQVGFESGVGTINALRQAFQLQRMFEKDARGGTRYTELVRSHFNVVSPDARLQRPEFLGGRSTPVNLSVVNQTAPGTTFGVGYVANNGTATGRDGFTKSFTEHCIVLGIVMIRADLTYQEGLPRMFSRRTKFDFFWPSLAHLGEQAVLRKEIFVPGTEAVPGTASASDDTVFGYQERYGEYRYFPSRITSDLRSTHATSQDVWHLAQQFASAPTLSQAFIEENPPTQRVLVTDSEGPFTTPFVFDSYLKLKCVRPMPVYAVPGMVDHF